MTLWHTILETLTHAACEDCGAEPGCNIDCLTCCPPDVTEELGPDDEWGTDGLRLRVHAVTPGDRTPDYHI